MHQSVAILPVCVWVCVCVNVPECSRLTCVSVNEPQRGRQKDPNDKCSERDPNDSGGLQALDDDDLLFFILL